MRHAGALFALVLGACAGSGTPSSRNARLVRTEDLPAPERAVLDAWRRGGEAWAVERERIVADPALARFLVDNLVVEMVRSYDRGLLRSAVQPAGLFDRAQGELVELGSISTPALVELLAVKDGVVAFLAADTLERIGAPALPGVAAKLADPDAEVRRRAAELLADLPNAGDREAAIEQALGERVEHDAAWIVRAEAARALGARAERHTHKGYAAAVLARALTDPDPQVSQTALAALSALGEPSAVPALIRRLERAAHEGDMPGLQGAQAALRRLTGETRNLDPEEWWRRWNSRGANASRDPRGDSPGGSRRDSNGKTPR